MEGKNDSADALDRLEEVTGVLSVESGTGDESLTEVRRAATNLRLAAEGAPERVGDHLDVVDERLQAQLERSVPAEPAASLSGDDREVVRTQVALLRALALVARADPGLLTDHAEGLVAATEADSPEVRYLGSLLLLPSSSTVSSALPKSSTTITRDAKGTLQSVAAEHPEAAAPHVGTVFTAMELADTDRLRSGCVTGLGPIAEAAPAAVAEHVEEIVTAMDGLDDRTASEACATALRRVAADRPEAVVPYVEDIVAMVDLVSISDDNEAYARTVRAVAAERPGEVSPYTGDIVTALDADSKDVVAASALALAEIARGEPEAVAAHIDDLLAAFEAADFPETSEACAEPLVALAEGHPDAVADHTAALVEMLDDNAYSSTCVDYARVLRAITERRPDEVSTHISDLVDALQRAELPFESEIEEQITGTLAAHGSDAVALEAIETAVSNNACTESLRTVASDHPDVLASQSDDLVAALGAEGIREINAACADAFRGIVDDQPAALPTDELTDEEGAISAADARGNVALAVTETAATDPEAFAPHVGALFTAMDELETVEATDAVRDALLAVEAARPDAVRDGAIDRVEAADTCALVLEEIATADPGVLAAEVGELVAALDEDELDALDGACAGPLRRVAENHPDHVPTAELISMPPHATWDRAVGAVSSAVRAVAGEEPEALAPHVDALFTAVSEFGHGEARKACAGAIGLLADEQPAAVAERSVDLVEANDAGAEALRIVAAANPELAAAHTGGLVTAFGADDLADATAACTDALRTVAAEHPEAVAGTVEDLLTAPGATDLGDVTGAAGAALQAVARAEPDAITPHVEELVGATVGALAARQADTAPLALYRCRNKDCSAVFAARSHNRVRTSRNCNVCGESRLRTIGQVELVDQ